MYTDKRDWSVVYYFFQLCILADKAKVNLFSSIDSSHVCYIYTDEFFAILSDPHTKGLKKNNNSEELINVYVFVYIAWI